MANYLTCDINVITKGLHGCFFCNKSLYTYLNNNVGKYSLFPVKYNVKLDRIDIDQEHPVATIPADLCTKIFFNYKKTMTNSRVNIVSISGREFAYEKKTNKLLGSVLNNQTKTVNSYAVDVSMRDAIEEYSNIVLLQKLLGDDYEKYILHPHENILLYLILKDDSPPLYEFDRDNRQKTNRYSVPILLSKGCGTRSINLTKRNINKYITDIIRIFSIIHNKGFVHGDFKIINSVKCGDGYKIIDWGELTNLQSNHIITCTYIMPIYALYVLYLNRHVETFPVINSWEEMAKYEKMYHNYIAGSHFIYGGEGHRFAVVSYQLFYNYYTKHEINVQFIKKKNDEYALAFEIYIFLLKYISSDEIMDKLFSMMKITAKPVKTNTTVVSKSHNIIEKVIMNMYYLMSPEYLSLVKL